jgi:hypothetical protein
MWSLGCLVAKAGKVAPSHIINKNQDNIGTLSEGRIGKSNKEQETKNCFHVG